MDWFMFGMVIETGPKFYVVPFPAQKVTDSEFLYKSNWRLSYLRKALFQ